MVTKFNNSSAILYPTGLVEKGLSRKEVALRKKRGAIPDGALIFDSELEARYYRDEILPKIGKTIRHVDLQPQYVLIDGFTKNTPDGPVKYQAMTYSPDFLVEYMDGQKVAIDTKGYEDERFKVKRKLFDNQNRELPLLVMKWVQKYGGWITDRAYAQVKAREKKISKASVIQPAKRKKRG